MNDGSDPLRKTEAALRQMPRHAARVGSAVAAAGSLAWASVAGAGALPSLTPAGVLGNSGVEGPSLLRVAPTPQPSGIYASPDLTVWLDGGDAILHATFDGRLIERYPLAPACERVHSWAFAELKGTLWFLGLAPKTQSLQAGHQTYRSRMALFALAMERGATPRAVRPFPEMPDHRGGVLAAQPRNGRLLIAKRNPERNGEDVFEVHPEDGSSTLWIATGAENLTGLAWDAERERLFVGGRWPEESSSPQIAVFDSAGRVLARATVIVDGANPTQFRGIVSFAGDALWEGAWYGHLARWSRNLERDPGIVWTWNLAFNYPCQLAMAVPGHPNALFLSEHDNQHAYLGAWDPAEQRFRLARRIGSLAEVTSLGLSEDGWVVVGTGGRTLWWRWEDEPTSPPRVGNHQAGVVNGYFHEGRWVTLTTSRGEARPLGITFDPAEGRGSGQPDYGQYAPWVGPAGLTRLGDWVYATVTNSERVWRATWHRRHGMPIAARWTPLDGAYTLSRPGDLAALPGGRLAVADGGDLVVLQVRGHTAELEKRLHAWNPPDTDSFGTAIRLASDSEHLLVADTDRHRVLAFDAETLRPVGEAGLTDTAGSGIADFDRPSAVAVAGRRAVVWDAGNQRLVKLALPPR